MSNDAPAPISDEVLFQWNRGACILHFVQGAFLLASSFTAPGVKDFEKDITTNWLEYDETVNNLVSKSDTIGTIKIGLVAAIFLLMSAVAHAYVLVFWEAYLADIKNECNHARWYEYAVSSSLMIVAIAVLFGCYDVASLLLISVCNASMCLFGLLMERMNPPDRTSNVWLPFWFGCFAGLGPWIVVFMYFLGGGNFDEIPGFVYGILIAYLVFFNTFPVNMVLQYAKIGRWSEYRYGELGYITLSLISKSFLGWLVFGGSFQPDGDDDMRDDFFEAEREPFEWYHPYAMVRGIIRNFASEEDNIIILGCGNSRMCEDMAADGYLHLMNIDFSRVVVEQMTKKYEDSGLLPEGCEFYQLDITDMTPDEFANEYKRGIPDGTYEVALDKGTIDCLLCAEDGSKRFKQALHEIDRILKPDGVYIIVSHSPPNVMISFLDSTDDVEDVEDFYGWTVDAHQIAKPTIDRNKAVDLFDPRNTYFIYVCEKDEDRSAAKAKHKIHLVKQKEIDAIKLKQKKMKAKGR